MTLRTVKIKGHILCGLGAMKKSDWTRANSRKGVKRAKLFTHIQASRLDLASPIDRDDRPGFF